MKKVLLAVIVFTINCNQVVVAAELQDILKNFTNTKEKYSRFTEIKTAYFLDEPLVIKGFLKFKAPSNMIKYIVEPENIEQRIEGDRISIYQNKELKNMFSLTSQPELATGINVIRWVLSGDSLKLNEHFNSKLTLNKYQWQIEFIPKDIVVHESISSIFLTGKKGNITLVNVLYANGDTTKMELYEHH